MYAYECNLWVKEYTYLSRTMQTAFQSDYAASSNKVLISILILSTIRPRNFCQIRSKIICQYTSNLPFRISDEVKPLYIEIDR